MEKKYTDEQADAIIKARIEQFIARGGKGGKGVKWSEEEIELKDTIIMGLLTQKALSKYRTAQVIKERWGIGLSTARQYVTDAINRWAAAYVEEDEGKQKQMFLETLENLLTDSIQRNQKESALKALDMVSKVKGYYVNKQDVNLTANGKMTFTFGETNSDNGD